MNIKKLIKFMLKVVFSKYYFYLNTLHTSHLHTWTSIVGTYSVAWSDSVLIDPRSLYAVEGNIFEL